MVKDLSPAPAPAAAAASAPAPAASASVAEVVESTAAEKTVVSTPTPGSVSGGGLVSAVAASDSPEPALEQPGEPEKKQQKRTGGRKARKNRKGRKNHRS